MFNYKPNITINDYFDPLVPSQVIKLIPIIQIMSPIVKNEFTITIT